MEEIKQSVKETVEGLLCIKILPKINDIIRWINVQEANQRKAKEGIEKAMPLNNLGSIEDSKEEEIEKVLEKVEECLAAYMDKGKNPGQDSFNRDVRHGGLYIGVVITPLRYRLGFNMVVDVTKK